MTLRRYYYQSPRRCSKPLCTRCPHGPYWWLDIRDEAGKLVSRKYLGRELGPEHARAADKLAKERIKWRKVKDRRRAKKEAE